MKKSFNTYSSPMVNGYEYPKYADILLDSTFKRTFGSERYKRVMLLFLQILLPEKNIKDIRYVNTEHINPFPEMKNIRVDVECLSSDGSRFVVEMQHAYQPNINNRMLYYSAFAVMSQLRQGEGSNLYNLKPVYMIGIYNFSLHKDSDKVLWKYQIKCTTDESLFTDGLTFITLELPNCKKALTEQATLLDNICYALLNMQTFKEQPSQMEGEFFNNLFESAEFINFTDEEQIKYFKDMTTKEDIQAQLEYCRQEGERKGKAEGLAEGSKTEKLAIAKTMLSDGMDIHTISKYTGLSIAELEALK